MNRREFLNPGTLFRACRQEANPPFPGSAAKRNDLFLLAMAHGIDPATINPEQLPELLGVMAGGKDLGQ